LRLVFAGTPAFAVPALEALIAAGHEVAAVYSQPDRPARRGRQLSPSAVTARARELGLPIRQPERFTPDTTGELASLEPEAMVVVAYGLILPKAVLAGPKRGCFNIHASLLPRWRGAAPIQRAVLAGDRETGVTIMRMDEGLDTGPMLLRETLPIASGATAGDVQAQLAPMGARLMAQALASLDTLRETAQPAGGVTYARKISKDEARLDWSLPAGELVRRVLGFNPAPVAWTGLEGVRVRLWRARLASATVPERAGNAPGTVLRADAQGIVVAAGEGAVLVTEVQWPGGKALAAGQAVAGRALEGKRFD
jgi:methionyl-tRNA formyltransferase